MLICSILHNMSRQHGHDRLVRQTDDSSSTGLAASLPARTEDCYLACSLLPGFPAGKGRRDTFGQGRDLLASSERVNHGYLLCIGRLIGAGSALLSIPRLLWGPCLLHTMRGLLCVSHLLCSMWSLACLG